MRIGFDMGHTLSGLGTGAGSIVRETDVNREVGKLVIKYLQEMGETVINCTVDSSGNDLADRVYIANKNNVDVFVSLHLNAGGGTGVETYVYNGNYSGKEKNKEMARKVNDAIAGLGFRNRGLKEANFYVVRETVAPAYLIELFFVDSQADVNTYNSLGADRVARTIAEAICGKRLPSTGGGTGDVKKVYRVRKTWADASSQKGAYSDLNNAIAECKKYSGYSVFDWNGVQVYPTSNPTPPTPPTPPTTPCDREIKRYGETGRCTINNADAIFFRNKPCTHCGVVQDKYYRNESVNYDLVVITEGYVWVSWLSASTGARRYMPIKDQKTGERWAVCV